MAGPTRGGPRGSASGLQAAALAAALFGSPCPAGAQPASAPILDDAVAASLTGAPGDPARGRAIVTDRTRGLCLLCHSGPFPEQRFQGTLSPDLSGTGTRWSEGQLRLRLVDSRRLNPETIMPPYGVTDRLERVGAPWRGRTLLSPAEIEDVVAYLTTLRN